MEFSQEITEIFVPGWSYSCEGLINSSKVDILKHFINLRGLLSIREVSSSKSII